MPPVGGVESSGASGRGFPLKRFIFQRFIPPKNAASGSLRAALRGPLVASSFGLSCRTARRKGTIRHPLFLWGRRHDVLVSMLTQMVVQEFPGHGLLAFVEDGGHFVEVLDHELLPKRPRPLGFLYELGMEPDEDLPDPFPLFRGEVQHARQMVHGALRSGWLPEAPEPAGLADGDGHADEAPRNEGQGEGQQALKAGTHQKNTS